MGGRLLQFKSVSVQNEMKGGKEDRNAPAPNSSTDSPLTFHILVSLSSSESVSAFSTPSATTIAALHKRCANSFLPSSTFPLPLGSCPG